MDKKLTESEILACRKYRDILAKKCYTTADINFIYSINRDLRDDYKNEKTGM